jgi:hypothetical protein
MTDPIEAAKALPAAKTDPADTLGEGGVRALESERKARREAERQLRELQATIQERDAADLRREVALEKGLTPSQATRLVGTTREELEADAADLVSSFAPVGPALRRTPVEKLQPGAAPSEPPLDAAKIADSILSK